MSRAGGHSIGKDFVSGYIAVYFFLTRSPCRIVTTSAKGDHLQVLWGEINNFIQTCKYKLDYKKGGPLVLNHQHIRKMNMGGPLKGTMCSLSYITSLVAAPDSMASLGGHHVAHTGDGIPRALLIADECSSVPEGYFTVASPWRHRALFIGNTWEGAPWWKRNIEEGDIPMPDIVTEGTGVA